jgi:non-specific serine/threonine protein kinase
MNLLTAEVLNEERIMRIIPAQTAEQGRQDYRAGRVALVSVDAQSARLQVADHRNGRPYAVGIWLQGPNIMLTCSCAQSYQWNNCRHRFAAFLGLRDYLRRNPPKIWKVALDQAAKTPSRRAAQHHSLIVFSLQERSNSWSIVPYTLAARNFSPEQIADPELAARAIETIPLSGEAKALRSRISRYAYPNASEESVVAANLVTANPYAYYGYAAGQDAAFYDTVLSFLSHCLVYLGDEGDPLQGRVSVLQESGMIEATLGATDKGLQLSGQIVVGERAFSLQGGDVTTIVQEPLWLLIDDVIVRVNNADGFTTSLVRHHDLAIPTADQDEFLDKYLPPLMERVAVRGDGVAWEDVTADPTPRLYLSEPEGQFRAELRFDYGGYKVAYDKRLPAQSTQRKPGTTTFMRIHRQPEREQATLQSLYGHGLKRGPDAGILLLRSGKSAVDFLLHQVPRLVEAGYTIFGEEALTSARVNRNKPTISFNVSSGIDWFDVQAVVNYGDLAVSLKDLRQAVRRREKYIKLADGSIGALPEEWIERYRHLLALSEENGDGLRLSKYHVTMLDQLLAEADRTRTDKAFEQRRERLRDFSGITPHTLPPTFEGELRPYQKFGYDWLHFLREYQFGGCLADDMGVGKTIQALALLDSIYHTAPNTPASLIVMPRSLLFNWQREAEKFAPQLNVYIHADQGRIADSEAFSAHNLVLTTYGTMLRDVELLRGYQFHYVILDESQAIKNPLAETSKAARLLRGEHRLVLTGTPVENSTLELWSQFAFLNPGLLGNLDYFREEFVTPIERQQKTETSQFLRKMVYPFILRRTKDQVAPELPPRTERVIVGEMEPAQRKLYNKQRDYYRALLLKLIDGDGMNDARMKILEGLLRLRQICNHPKLVDDKFRGASGKFELLMETLETLRAEGHRALIFSQFVQMLTIVREALDAQGIPYAYLDGQTRNRQEAVDRFQNGDDLPFFLISLKAGGVGLNLTAADYVIHIDPWWNPAVEMQATDRTHRIGQDKPVFVYKLVTRDSVEEKILQLQDRKRELVEQIIGAESGVFKSLTREDVEALFS